MNSLKLCNQARVINSLGVRLLSTTHINYDIYKCKVLVVGGGSAGCAMASKFGKKYGKEKVIVLEPSGIHFYQPMFTLVGGGMKTLESSGELMRNILPKTTQWLKDAAAKFNPSENSILTKSGDTIKYDVMIVAMGLELNYDKIPGLVEALSLSDSGVCSNYSAKYVNRTLECLKKFKKGNAIFTFPASPVKCPGAPQKIAYIAEEYFRKNNKRSGAKVIYNTSLPVLFGVKHYADALWKIIKKRDMQVNLRTNLIEILPKKKQAVFENLDSGEKFTTDFEMLHVTPPMSTPEVLRKSCIVDDNGFVNVSKETLQHIKYKNIFAMGDNSNSPNSKTGASAAAQSPIVYKNALSVLDGKAPKEIYDGYASCPLVTGYSTCILAEFDYNLKPLETFPIAQNKERYSMFFMKKNIMPIIYWRWMMKGLWDGPEKTRKIFNIVRFGKQN